MAPGEAASAYETKGIIEIPDNHQFWDHPRVVVTPHIAAFSLPETAVESVVNNIDRIEAGQPPLNAVDFERGY